MDENLHNIENLFRNALDDNEETASDNVWEAIDKRLDKDKIVSIKRKYTNLKRIAIMLLLLLTSYVLYDVYKVDGGHGSNGFVKYNNVTDSGTQSGLSVIPDTKSNDKKLRDNKAGINNTNIQKNENAVAENNVVENTNTLNINKVNKKEILPMQNTKLQKHSASEVTTSVKNETENPTAIILIQKKKYSTKSASKIKITNATVATDEDILVINNDEQQFKEIPTLRKLNTISIERVPLPHDSIDRRKLMQLVVKSSVNTTGTANNSVAKNNNKKSLKLSRFSITPFFSPDIAWYRLQDNEVNNQHDNASELEKEEKHEFSSTYGALIDYKISKHWGLQSGLTFSNTNITVEPKTIYAQQVNNTGSVKYRINTSSGYGYVLPSFSSNPVVGDSLYAFTSTHSLQYIGIPLAVTYNVTKGKFKFNALAGISANILTRAKLETTVEKGFNNALETVNNLQGLRKMYFSGMAGVGVDYKLSKKTAVTFAPTMRFALNSINKDATVKSYPMSFGFAVGLKLDL